MYDLKLDQLPTTRPWHDDKYPDDGQTVTIDILREYILRTGAFISFLHKFLITKGSKKS
jgi:hypothetical protein